MSGTTDNCILFTVEVLGSQTGALQCKSHHYDKLRNQVLDALKHQRALTPFDDFNMPKL